MYADLEESFGTFKVRQLLLLFLILTAYHKTNPSGNPIKWIFIYFFTVYCVTMYFTFYILYGSKITFNNMRGVLAPTIFSVVPGNVSIRSLKLYELFACLKTNELFTCLN